MQLRQWRRCPEGGGDSVEGAIAAEHGVAAFGGCAQRGDRLVVAAIVGVHPFRRTGPVAIPFGSAGSATLLVTPFDTGEDTSRLARLQSTSKRVKNLSDSVGQ